MTFAAIEEYVLQVKDNRIKELEEQLEELQQELNDEKQEYDNEIEEITTQHNEEIQVTYFMLQNPEHEVSIRVESIKFHVLFQDCIRALS